MAETENPIIQMLEAFKAGIKNGDPNHGYSLCQMLLSEGPNFDPEVLIEVVEGILDLSVLAGSEMSKEYLEEQWPVLKRNHLNRLIKKSK